MLITAGHFWLHAPHRFNPGGNGLAYLHGGATNGLGDSRYNKSVAFGKLAAIPNGSSNQTSWVLPRKAGGMSSYREATLAVDSSGTILGGKALVGEVVLTITTNIPDGQLVSTVPEGGAPASFTLSTNTPLLTASISGEGDAVFTITFDTATLGAEASVEGSVTISLTGGLTPYAIGIMEGSTVDSSVLTSTAIADAVWAALASQNNDSGTMGEQLNNAGSGGIDIGALADAIADAVLSDPALLTVGKFLGLK